MVVTNATDFTGYGNAVEASTVTLEPGLWSLNNFGQVLVATICLLYTSPSPRDRTRSRMPSSA